MHTLALLATLGLAAVAGLVIVLFVFRGSPRIAVACWTLALFFVPVWVGVGVGLFWSVLTALTLVMLIVSLPEIRFGPIDLWVVGVMVLCTLLLMMGEIRLSAYVQAGLEWLIPYAWGRVVLARVTGDFLTRCIATVATVAAVLAIIEFATEFNPFVLLPGSGIGYETWSPIQYRGGLPRAEGAFGHSIALGAVLAMSSAFVLAVRWYLPIRLLALSAITAATLLTFSRIGLVTLVLTIALSVALLHTVSLRAKMWTILGIAVAGIAVLPVIGAVFEDAGDEADGSAGYRADLLVLLSQVRVIGGAGDWESLVVGDVYLGDFARSTDNAVISLLLRFGTVPTLALLAVYAFAIVYGLRRARTPALVAIMGQVVSLFAVALITQYASMLWFLIGLTIAWAERSRTPPPPLPGSQETEHRDDRSPDPASSGVRTGGPRLAG